ncbi:unnamed protein product, partial [Ectocarpus fasciculatus]
GLRPAAISGGLSSTLALASPPLSSGNSFPETWATGFTEAKGVGGVENMPGSVRGARTRETVPRVGTSKDGGVRVGGDGDGDGDGDDGGAAPAAPAA